MSHATLKRRRSNLARPLTPLDHTDPIQITISFPEAVAVRPSLMVVPERLHQAWHYIFRNMTPEEAMIYIAAQWAPAGYIKYLRISNGRFEIVMSGRDLIALRGKNPDRPNVPGFADAKLNAHIKEVYRRRNKRRRRR